MYGARPNRRDQRGGLSPNIIFLLLNIYQQLQRLPVKPPVTIALLFINIASFVLPNANFFEYDLTNIQQNCILPHTIITNFYKYNELNLNRLFLSSIIHADDMHLYYNMTSLCWKGINLELSMGSQAFLVLVIYSLVASHSLIVLASYVLTVIFKMDASMTGYHSCAVGFSAVLFSLKYVLNYRSPTHSNIMGISVPTKYAAWLELVTISMMNPSASFMGHLCGIFAGVLYVHVPDILLVISTLSSRISIPASSSSGGSTSSSASSSHGGQNRYTYASGTSSSSSSSSNSIPRSRPTVTATAGSTTSSSAYESAPQNPTQTAEDIRRERMKRYKSS